MWVKRPPKRRFDALSTSRFGWAADVTAAQHDPTAYAASD